MNNILTWEEYSSLFNEILTAETPKAPYDNPDYLDYTKLNNSRQNRWLKTESINEELASIIKKYPKSKSGM